MDGGNENQEINLKKVVFWPDNIVDHFKTFGVKKTFDLLSVDTDSYDFFMLEAILLANYTPRVIIVEYNANFEITEAKSIMPPAEGDCFFLSNFCHIIILLKVRAGRGGMAPPTRACPS